MITLICIPTRDTFEVYDVTPTTFKAKNIPVDFNFTTRFLLDGKPIKITNHVVNAMYVSTFTYHELQEQ
jgi:hypothetical protein